MKTLITDEYKELNSDLHSRNPLFGSKAYKQADNVVESLEIKPGETLLDYGCGKGSLGREMSKRGYKVINYDPAIRMFEKHPSEYEGYPFRYVACMDVLEHIEPNCLKSVLEDVFNSFTHKAFILVDSKASNKTLPDGRNAHLILQSRNWWLDRLEEHSFVVERLVDNREGWSGWVCSKEKTNG